MVEKLHQTREKKKEEGEVVVVVRKTIKCIRTVQATILYILASI